MEKYKYVEEFKAKYCDVDFKDELKPSAYLAFFEEVACASADELGFGYEYLKPLNYGFIVSGVRCKFYTPVRIGQKFRVETWPNPPSYAAFERQYRVRSKDGETLADASSRWAMVDWSNGRLLSSKVLTNQDYSTYNPDRTIENVCWKIPKFAKEEGELRFQITVANSEYDHYYHVNNTRYADYCFNCFTVAELSARPVGEFAITYVKQCHENDVLSFYRKEMENGAYLIEGLNQLDEIVVSCFVQFV